MASKSTFTNEDVEEILRIIDGLNDVEIRIEHGDLKLHVRKFSGTGPISALSAPDDEPVQTTREASPALPPARTSVAAAASPEAIPEEAVAIRAPMLGRFFRAASPSEPAFVEVGKQVKAGDPVCLLEVMKLFTTVNAGVNGTVIAISAENGEMVEHGQPLFLIRPE